MAEAYIHKFRGEDTDQVRRELKWHNPREVTTPRKETISVTELVEENMEMIGLLDRVQAQIGKEEDISQDLQNLREEIREVL